MQFLRLWTSLGWVQPVLKTVEVPQLQYFQGGRVPVVPVQFPSAGVEKTAELPHTCLVALKGFSARCFSTTGAGLGSASAQNIGGFAVAVLTRWSCSDKFAQFPETVLRCLRCRPDEFEAVFGRILRHFSDSVHLDVESRFSG